MSRWSEKELRAALKDGSFHLYYQPIVSLKRSTVVGLEALARWNHASRGILSPDAFMADIERCGLTGVLGEFCLEKACGDLKRWLDAGTVPGDIKVSVNIPPEQWSRRSLVGQIRAVLERTGLPPRSLKLEITEGSAMDNPRLVQKMVLELRKIGVQCALDDFGTGHSSLAHLRNFSVSTLKIDRAFVVGLETQRKAAEIINTIVSLAHSLGMDVVAEGVETPTQRRRLARLNCEYGQGFLFARPMDEHELQGYLGGFIESTQPEGIVLPPDETAEHDRPRPQRRNTRSAPASARLVVRSGPGAGIVVELQSSELIIGRSPDATVTILDTLISRHHARIYRDSTGGLMLTDLDSRNGTFCNEQRIEKCPLKDGDSIRVGRTVIEIWIGGKSRRDSWQIA